MEYILSTKQMNSWKQAKMIIMYTEEEEARKKERCSENNNNSSASYGQDWSALTRTHTKCKTNWLRVLTKKESYI